MDRPGVPTALCLSGWRPVIPAADLQRFISMNFVAAIEGPDELCLFG
jgi:hypothetical protein